MSATRTPGPVIHRAPTEPDLHRHAAASISEHQRTQRDGVQLRYAWYVESGGRRAAQRAGGAVAAAGRIPGGLVH